MRNWKSYFNKSHVLGAWHACQQVQLFSWDVFSRESVVQKVKLGGVSLTYSVTVNCAALIPVHFCAVIHELSEKILWLGNTIFFSIFASPGSNVDAVVDVSSTLGSCRGSEVELLVNFFSQISDEPCKYLLIIITRHALRQVRKPVSESWQPWNVISFFFNVSNDVNRKIVFDNSGEKYKIIIMRLMLMRFRFFYYPARANWKRSSTIWDRLKTSILSWSADFNAVEMAFQLVKS